LQRAIEIEPSFAPAYDGLAFSYLLASGWFLPPRDCRALKPHSRDH
jgi:hypothetical protein